MHSSRGNAEKFLPSFLSAAKFRARLPRLSLWAAMCLSMVGITGCGSGGSLANPAPVVYPNLTGNWQIQTNAGAANLGVLLVGYLSETDSVVTGALQFTNLVPGNACGSSPYTIGVNGTVDADGKLVLTSSSGSNLPAVAVNLQLSPGVYDYAYGTVAVTAPSSCVYASTGALGVHVGAVTGKYAGTPALTGAISGVGLSNASLTLTQAATANANGSFLVTGNLAFSGAACSVSLPVQGSILGVGLVLSSPLVQGASQPEVTIEATANADQSQLSNASLDFHSGQCTASSSGFADYQGVLKRAK